MSCAAFRQSTTVATASARDRTTLGLREIVPAVPPLEGNVPTLTDAYNNVVSVLKPQKQGTCGLYSFWFATLLLNSIRTDRKPVVYPRGCEGMPPGGLSLRNFSKVALGSGQGELLNYDEIFGMIVGFGWDFDFDGGGGEQRQAFISKSLSQNKPVMFSFLAGGSSYGGEILVMPLTDIPLDRGCGPHWSLIVAENADGYGFVEPNQPLRIKWDYKTRVLRSNEIVDSFVMAEEWVKPVGTPPGQSTVMPRPAVLRPDLHRRTYTVKVNGRQALNNLLFAVH